MENLASQITSQILIILTAAGFIGCFIAGYKFGRKSELHIIEVEKPVIVEHKTEVIREIPEVGGYVEPTKLKARVPGKQPEEKAS